MPEADVRWIEHAKAFASDVGPRTESGRRKRKYFHGLPNTRPGKSEARRQLKNYIADRDKEEAESVEQVGNPRIWPGIVKPFLDSVGMMVDSGSRSPETYRSHAERLSVWVQWQAKGKPKIGERLAKTLTEEDATQWIAHLKEQGRSSTRIQGLMSSVQACLNWAANPLPGREPRVLLKGGNPFASIAVEGAERRKIPVATRAEIARFLRAARAEIEPWNAGGRKAGDWYKAPIILDAAGNLLPPELREKARKARCDACRKAGKEDPCRRSHNLRSVYFRAAVLLCRLQATSGTRPKELCEASWKVQVEGKQGWTPKSWKDDKGHWWGLIVVPGKTYAKTKRVRSIPVPPLLARAIERLRHQGLSDDRIFPRLARTGAGAWNTDGIDKRVRAWRNKAGLGPDFQLYALRHRFYTEAVSGAGLTADQAGLIGGTSGEVVRRKYLQEDLGAVFHGAARVRTSSRARESDR